MRDILLGAGSAPTKGSHTKNLRTLSGIRKKADEPKPRSESALPRVQCKCGRQLKRTLTIATLAPVQLDESGME